MKKLDSQSLLKQRLLSSPASSDSGTSTPTCTTPNSPGIPTSKFVSPSLSSATAASSHRSSMTLQYSEPFVKETHEIQIDYDPVSGRKVLNSYEIIKELGRGQHGKVKLARDIKSGQYAAIKVVDRSGRKQLGRSLRAPAGQEEKVRREIAILKKCNHPNIVKLLEVLDDVKSRKIYLVLEYMEKGEIVWQNADGSPALSREMAKSTARDVILGLEYLHFQGIIHRDIKPANLLISQTGQVKISDFGVSYATTLNYENGELELAKTAGTPAFFAPELCYSSSSDDITCIRPPISHKIDIWALGVTIFCFIYGCTPYTADSEYELFKVIVEDPLIFPDEENDSLSSVNDDEIYDSMSKSQTHGKKSLKKKKPRKPQPLQNSMFYNLHDEPSLQSDSSVNDSDAASPAQPAVSNDVTSGMARITLTESAAYVSNDKSPKCQPAQVDADLELAKDLIRKLLEKDPVKRIDIPDIKRHPWISDGMTAPNLETFLSTADNDKLIEVTDKDMKVAVRDISGKIKRGLKSIGASALEFAGIRRKSSNASIYTFMTSSTSPSRATSPDGYRSALASKNRTSSTNSTASSIKGKQKSGSEFNSHCASPLVGTGLPGLKNDNHTTSSLKALEDEAELPKLEKRLSNLNSIPISSSNINLNALLAGDGMLEAIDAEEHNLYANIPPVAVTDSSSSNSASSVDDSYHEGLIRERGTFDFHSDDDSESGSDDDGELTLVLGRHRQFPSVSQKKESTVRRAASISSLRKNKKYTTRDRTSLGGGITRSNKSNKSNKSSTNASLRNSLEHSELSGSILEPATSSQERGRAKLPGSRKLRSNSVTVGILQRHNASVSSPDPNDDKK